MAGLPVCLLIGGATRSASCAALNSRSRDASLRGLDGSFQEWSLAFRGRWWRLGDFGVVCCDASFLRAFGRPGSRVDALGRRGGHQVIAVSRHLCFFTGCAFDRRDVAGCRRAPVGRVKRANGLLALLRQPRRKRRAASWPRTPEKAKLSEPHGARRARSFRAHRRRALFHLRARGPRGAPKLLKNGRS